MPAIGILLATMLTMYTWAAVIWTTHIITITRYYDGVKIYSRSLECQASAYWTLSQGNQTLFPNTCPVLDYGIPGDIHATMVCLPTIVLVVNVSTSGGWHVLC